MTSHTQIAESIASWTPSRHGLERDVARRLADEARRFVSRADWTNATAAKLACGHIFRYLAWRDTQADQAGDAAMVQRYLADLAAQGAPRGTTNPVRSALHRCIAAPVVEMPAKRSTTPTEAVAGYVPDPRRVAPALWVQVEDLARSVVALTAPSTPRQAVSRLAPTGLYLAWAKAADGDRDQFSPASIERFLATGRSAWPLPTFRTYASVLRQVARTARPELWPRSTDTTDSTGVLYDLDELEVIAHSVRVRTTNPRRHVGALVMLSRGAGVTGASAAAVRPTDVEGRGDSATVTVTHGHAQRLVPVINAFAQPLVELAAQSAAAGDAYLLGGRSAQSLANRSSELTRTHAELTGVNVEPTRLRNTWLAWLIAQPLGLPQMLELAGLRSTTRLDAILRAGTVEEDPIRLSQIAHQL